MRIVKSLITVVMMLFVFNHATAYEKKITLAVLDWEPYAGQNLKKFGAGAEILTAVFNRAGYETEFHFMPWVRALKDTQIGKYDAVCFGYYSEERNRIYALSDPFMYSTLLFCKHRSSEISYNNLKDLQPYRIGVVRGYVNTDEFDRANYLNKEAANNETLNLRKLLNKRIDLVLIDKFVAQNLINTVFRENDKDFQFLAPPLKIHPVYVMFSRKIFDYNQKRLDFNKGLQQIVNDGTVMKIMEAHGLE